MRKIDCVEEYTTKNGRLVTVYRPRVEVAMPDRPRYMQTIDLDGWQFSSVAEAIAAGRKFFTI